MNRGQLEHLIRACADADDDEIVVLGSQSILGQFPDAPAEFRVSMEAYVYPRNKPERWELIDGSIGELSPFHDTFGYYAQGVEESTAVLPDNWQERLIRIKNQGTRYATGLCLEIHDLLISKYVAGRPKDRDFTRAAAKHGLASQAELLSRLQQTAVLKDQRNLIRARIQADADPSGLPAELTITPTDDRVNRCPG